jgi:hypothetical protein
MTRVMRCHDFAQDAKPDADNIANIVKEGDKVMGKNSCQPEGLQPQWPARRSVVQGSAQRGAGTRLRGCDRVGVQKSRV